MIRKLAVLFLAVALATMFIGCKGSDNLTSPGSSDPLDSKVRHNVALNGGQMTVVPAIDNGFLVNVVENGVSTYFKVDEVESVVWYGERAGWPPQSGVRVPFSTTSATLTIPNGEREGLLAYLTKGGRIGWVNIEFVEYHGFSIDFRRGLFLL